MQSQQQNRIKFKTTQDWHNFLSKSAGEITANAIQKFRQDCYKDIEQHRKHPLLVYATKLFDVPQGIPNFIDFPDVDGFTDLVNSVKDRKAVDVLLHSPGGRPDATERLVELLRNHFEEVNFLIPHSAYSAATMLALSGDSIILHSSAVLGPIDPQINGIPARAIKRSFEKIKEKLNKEGSEALLPYIPLIEKYSLELLELCEDSEKLSTELVTDWLKKYMFKKEKNADKKIQEVVKYFSNYDKHLIHTRPLSMKKLSKLELNIKPADKTLQDLMWEAYILINGFFSISSFVKIYENTKGISWGKQFQQVLVNQGIPQRPQKQPK
ncbi:MAG: hypothetical protein F4X95_02345 [Oligoflexia bacterium]|nr:hypothetical protein [Oligoflexia bacterium]